jgi:apolipoprotein N-acyltransferase
MTDPTVFRETRRTRERRRGEMPNKMTVSAVLGAAASGALTAVAFPKFDLMFFAWISLIPLFFLLAKARPGGGFVLGGTAGAVFYGILLDWVPAASAHDGRMPLFLNILIYLLLVLLLASTWALFGGLFAVLHTRRREAAFFVAPFLWIAIEYALTHVLTGFPWGLLGVSQYKNTAFIQMGAVTGVYGISFMLVLFQACFVASIQSLKRAPFAVATIAMAAVHLAGALAMPKAAPGAESFPAAVIQGHISSDARRSGMSADDAAAIFEEHMGLTRKARQAGAQLIVWPEASLPSCFRCGDAPSVRFKAALQSFVEETGATLVIGSTETLDEGPAERRFNTSLCLAPGRAVSRYAKMRLTPFGEYTPVPSVFGSLNKYTRAGGGLTPGRFHALHSFRDIAFGTPIGSEIAFPDLVRRFTRKGARFLITIAAEGGDGRSAAPYQHFAAAVLRAAENRRFLLRAATTGISGIIDPAGRVLQQTDIGTPTFQLGEVAPAGDITFYVRYGDVFAGLGLTISALSLILALFQIPKKRDS